MILAMVLETVGVPAAGAALIMGVDRILNTSRAAVNVSGDLVAAVVMERWSGSAARASAPGRAGAAALTERSRQRQTSGGLRFAVSTPDAKAYIDRTMQPDAQPRDLDGEDLGARVLASVAAVAAEVRPGQALRHAPQLDSRLDRDLGFDSLARVELIARIERDLGVALAESVLSTVETPRDLLAAVLQAGPALLPLQAGAAMIEAQGTAAAAPDSVESLVEMLQWHVQAHPERVHLQFYDDAVAGETLTYTGLWQGACTVAAGLQRRGLEPGQCVTLMLPSSRDYFFSFFGVLIAGGIPVPIYPPVRPKQLEDHLRRQVGILRNCQAAMMITVPEARLVAHLLTSQVETLRHVVTVEELGRERGTCEAAAPRAQDIGFIQYTSGSTGNPKGVVLSHANLLANIRADGAAIRATPEDVFVSWLPLYHDMGLIGAWLGSLYHAVRLVVMSPLAFLQRPQRWLWAMHRYGGTLSAAPNFAYELCLRRVADSDIAELDLSRWRLAFNGAEPISPTTLEAFCTRFADYGFRRAAMFPVYGLAECAVGLAFPPLGREPLIDCVQREALMRTGRALPAPTDDATALRLVACGQPLPGHELRVVDARGRELPDREEGRLQFRGPSATRGYHRNPQATAALFQGEWLESGDLAYIADGDLYLTGRSKDLIIRAGRNIYPAELEEAVGELDGIRKGRVAVFASHDARAGTERLIVLAETRASDPAVREGLLAQINTVVGDLAAGPPDEVVLAPPNSVLKTSSGKIRRVACRELYEQGRLKRPPRAVWLQLLRLSGAGVVPLLRRWQRNGAAAAYAAYAWGCCALMTPLAGLAVALPQRWRWPALRAVLGALAAIVRIPIEVCGREHLPAQGAGCVIVCNHQSYLDSFVLIAALPGPMSFLAKAELQANALVHGLLRRLGTCFVQRDDTRAGLAEQRRAADIARAGGRPVIFAEGTFKRMPGLLPFHMGAFVTAVEAAVPLVPVAIRGTRSILRGDEWFPRRGAITVTVGEALCPDAAAERWAAALQLRDAARAEILRGCGEPDLEHESNLPPPAG